MESRLSFPSGHTSMSFAGLTYLALFAAAKLQAFSARVRGQLWRIVPSAFCLAGATSVAITRVVDYWHFPFDVFMGGLIGMTIATVCYFLHFPSLSNQHCDIPLLSLGPDAQSCQLSCCGGKRASTEPRPTESGGV
ncbi:hypothetical protein CLOM_g12115 [Closterium sp. NIES-68]|nr:hypothetical protein CLOM_g12115 [Closterium sp. NIES-68]GJP61927.1 hypothetical protein CLOP_g19041 [Closterium sp. NIES-67]